MNIYCIGRNYIDHAKELNNPIPKNPIVFCKPTNAVLRDNKPFYIPDFTQEVHYEVEILIRIGKNGKHIPVEKAHEHYSHIGLGIDYTARDIQEKCKEKGLPWEIAKGFDNSAIISDWIEKENFNDRSVLFSLKKNKNVVQQGNSKDMIFSFEKIISYLSIYFRLQNGDIIFTGTPSGVGPVAKGDLLEGFIEDRAMFWCEIK
jgi:acylpyruvate hydrolase